MATRRDFLKATVAMTAAGTLVPSTARAAAPNDDRAYWVTVLDRLARPVLGNLARRELRRNMPVEQLPNAKRESCTHLEAFGRLLCGIAPWLAADGLAGDEAKLQTIFREQAIASLDAATDPASPDFMNFHQGGQPLVDTAFLAQGILRAPGALWTPLEPRVKKQLIDALKSSRKIPTPGGNNWVLFAAMVEAALLEWGERTIPERLEACVQKMLNWYLGDGAYGDGELFHFDYYNSYVIHPMLLDVLTVLATHDAKFAPARDVELKRARRFAQVQERLIAPDGTFPPLGRSTTYRFGAFQTLSQIALLGELPEPIKPAQVRCGLTAVLRRTTESADTFDKSGWLQIGFAGHQPGLAEAYISTGSLYLCSAALLPLGLPPANPFWSDPPAKWTQQTIWSGEDAKADHAMKDTRGIDVPRLTRP